MSATAPATSPNEQRPLRGVALMIAASLSYAGMGVSVKLASSGLSSFSVVAARSVVVVAVAVVLLRLRDVRFTIGNARWMWARSLIGFVAMCCYFYAISAIPLADAVTIQFTSPLFVALLSGVLLGERVTPRVGVLSAMAFCGVVLIVSPGFDRFDPRALAALASAILAAVAYIAVRKLRATDPPEVIVLHFALVALVLSAPAFFLEGRPPSTVELGALAGVGIFAAGGQLFMTYALRYGRAAHVSAISYATVLFSALLGLVILGEVPTPMAIAGGALIIAGGVGVSLERQA